MNLGYGGLANTGATRSFAGKTETEAPEFFGIRIPSAPSHPTIPRHGWFSAFYEAFAR